MKIYFEDGPLINHDVVHLPENNGRMVVRINADKGPSQNINALNYHNKNYPDCVIHTNSIFAFSNKYAWNDELKVPDVYIRAGENNEFTRIDKLTERELREGHNLAKMYIAGEFEGPYICKWLEE